MPSRSQAWYRKSRAGWAYRSRVTRVPPPSEEGGARPRWLGHSSLAITLGYYVHFMPKAGSKGRGTIEELLGEQGERHAAGTPARSPASSTIDSRRSTSKKLSVDCKAVEMGGLRKCWKRS